MSTKLRIVVRHLGIMLELKKITDFVLQWNTYAAVLLSRYFPLGARSLFIKLLIPQLPKRISHDPHFEPHYTPWQQRLCLCPDGDFFKALREKPTTNIVTGHIDTVTDTGIRMKDGTTVDADVIVTATGLQMLLGGDVAVTVDGEKIGWGGRLLWHGSMIQDVPNSKEFSEPFSPCFGNFENTNFLL